MFVGFTCVIYPRSISLIERRDDEKEEDAEAAAKKGKRKARSWRQAKYERTFSLFGVIHQIDLTHFVWTDDSMVILYIQYNYCY